MVQTVHSHKRKKADLIAPFKGQLRNKKSLEKKK